MRVCYICFVWVLLACSAEDKDCLVGNGDLVQVPVEVEDLRSLMVYNNIDVRLSYAPDTSVVLEIGENLLDQVRIEESAGELVVRNEAKCYWFRENRHPVLYVSVPDLDRLTLAGHGTVRSEGVLPYANLTIELSKSEGEVFLSLDALSVNVVSNSYGQITLEGQTENLSVNHVTNPGNFNGEQLRANKVDLRHSGQGKMTVFPVEQLDVEITFWGVVEYVGQPAVVNASILGDGQLIQRQ